MLLVICFTASSSPGQAPGTSDSSAVGSQPVTAPTVTAGGAPGERPQPSDTAERVPSELPTLGQYLRDIPGDIGGGVKTVFTRDNLPLLLVGAGATLLALPFDHKVKEYFQDQRPLDGSSKTGDSIGKAPILGGAALGLFAVGKLAGSRKMADSGFVAIESMAVDVIANEALKYAAHRTRPNGTNNMSFPSGHASATAAFAASVSETYDWDLRVAVPLYAVSTFVGFSRIQDNMHYLSDVIAGMTLGTIIGKSFAVNYKKKYPEEGSFAPRFSLSPLIDGTSRGLMLNMRF